MVGVPMGMGNAGAAEYTAVPPAPTPGVPGSGGVRA